eukprot:s2990_g18.t1
MGVVGNTNQPMKKGWTIAGNFQELSKLDAYVCDGSHKHDESRGEALKLAENYTFKLTDMLHGCFRAAAVAQSSQRKALLACPVKMVDPSAAAGSAGCEATLEATRERNRAWWDDMFTKMLYSMVIKRNGLGEEANDLIAGLRLSRTLKKYGLSAHYKEAKPLFVTEFIHEILWGKTLKEIAFRAVELAIAAIEKHGESANLTVMLA